MLFISIPSISSGLSTLYIQYFQPRFRGFHFPKISHYSLIFIHRLKHVSFSSTFNIDDSDSNNLAVGQFISVALTFMTPLIFLLLCCHAEQPVKSTRSCAVRFLSLTTENFPFVQTRQLEAKSL